MELIKDMSDAAIGKMVKAMRCSTTIAKTRTFNENIQDFPWVALEKFIQHGFQRKFNDAVGGADKTAEDKVAGAREMIAEYKRGEVAKTRASGEGVTEETSVIRMLMRQSFKAAYKKGNAERTKFEKLDTDAQNEALDRMFAANEEAMRPTVDEELATRKAARARKAELAGKLTLSV